MNKFSQLEVVGFGIVLEYTENAIGPITQPGDSLMLATLELGEQVQGIKAIHIMNGVLIRLERDSDGSSHLGESIYLDNSEYDWKTEKRGWIYRPISQRAYREMSMSRMSPQDN